MYFQAFFQSDAETRESHWPLISI